MYNPKFIHAIAYSGKGTPKQEAATIVVPLDAVACIEKIRLSDKSKVHFKSNYDYGLSFVPDLVEAEVISVALGTKIDII